VARRSLTQTRSARSARGAQRAASAVSAPSGLPAAATLAAIVAAADDAVVSLTPDGVITSWNPAAETIYGYPASEITGRPVADLSPAGQAGDIREITGKVRQGERVAHRRIAGRRRDGTAFPASMTVSPVHGDDGAVAGAAAVIRDLSETERAAAERERLAGDASRAQQSLATFTIAVSHDLVAPLRAMTGFSDALLEDCSDTLDDHARQYAQRIGGASERMTLLINQLLQLSLLARAPMRPERIDLAAEVSRIAGEMQQAGPGRQVRLVIGGPAWAVADPPLIQSVLRNLLDNAWKFTAGQDEAVIEFGTEPDGQAGVRYYLRDNGIGFDQVAAGKLFAPFWQLDPGRAAGGAGIGLAVVKQIVERHGGRVWAEGTAGAGATVYFTLGGEEHR
jgi:PAS domain S-box-containing protein